MRSAIVEQIEHGVQIRLGSGEAIPAQPLSLPDGIRLLPLWLRAKADPLPRPALLADVAEGAKVVDLTPEQRAAFDAWCAESATATADQVEASRLITEQFAEAVHLRPEDVPKLQHGDPLALLPGFFWRESGASVVRPSRTNGATRPTGTPSTASTSPPSA